MTTLQTALTTATTATSSATLTAGKHTPVDATSGALTMTLPTPATVGARLRVEKVDATGNAVTISGTIRGAAATLPLTDQYQLVELFAESLTSWRVAADHRTRASLDTAYARPRVQGILVAAGDSIPRAGDDLTLISYNDSYDEYACLFSGGALEFRANTAVGGRTSTQILAAFDTEVAPLKPTVVVWNGFTNDLFNSVTDAQYKANTIAYIAKVRAIGALPVVVGPFPCNSAGSAGWQRIAAVGAWLVRYCAANGVPCLDTLDTLMDPATGQYVSTYGGTDGTHPGQATHYSLGQALWNLLAKYPFYAPRRAATWNSDPSNLLANGLFQTGTTIATSWGQAWGPTTRTKTDAVLNSTTTITSATAAFAATDVGVGITGTGIPAGTTIASVTNSTTAVLSAAATATASGVTIVIGGSVAFSVVTDATMPGGKVQRMAFTAAAGHAEITQAVTTGFAVGDVLELSATVTNPAACYAQITAVQNGNSENRWVLWNYPITKATPVRRVTVVAGTTSITVKMSAGASSTVNAAVGNVDFAGLTLRNLTALGLP